MQITIYSTTTCPFCKMLKDYLASQQKNFTEKLVDQDDSAKEEMIQLSGGFLGVPFTVITKDDGSRETVFGFDQQRIKEILAL